jgi:hypothetical protein
MKLSKEAFLASIAEYLSLPPYEADEFLTLEEASKVFPGRPHKNTIRRYMHKGHRGKILRSWRCGNRLITNRRSIYEFLTENQPTKPIVSSSQMLAKSQLDTMGMKKHSK